MRWVREGRKERPGLVGRVKVGLKLLAKAAILYNSLIISRELKVGTCLDRMAYRMIEGPWKRVNGSAMEIESELLSAEIYEASEDARPRL